MPESTVDLLVRGAGPVGCALALALRGSPLRLAVLGSPPSRQAGTAEFRPIALSYASRLILERVGAWDEMPASPIDAIRVSQAGGFGRVLLQAAECGVPALGYVVDYRALRERLYALLAQSGIEVREDAPATRCTVHAEGVSEEAVRKRYAQDALVALVAFDPPAGATAHERFTAQGPLALLPCEGRYAIVWTTSPERAQQLLQASGQEFLSELAQCCGPRVGRPVAVESRSALPLALHVRSPRVAERAVYIGNAAQTLHPVAGQGLNLGLRDAWELAQILRDAPDPGDARLLARYATARRLDAGATIRVTDALATGFLGTGRGPRFARGLALSAIDVLPLPRRFFARRMMFGPSALP